MDRVRFAPSPTGELHLGNARTALYNWAAAQGGGAFVLRYDDTDVERSRASFADLIAQDLTWLGITPHETARQSERIDAYDTVAERLRAEGLLYPCYETPEELERKRAIQRARGRPPIYDRAALALTAEERAILENEGRKPHWRFKLPGGLRTFQDRCRGEQTVDLSSLSDPILVREDGSYLYTLPSVVDDRDMGITLVVRGEDHITNTGVQIALFEALGAEPPAFAHHNLLIRADGAPLSKRDNPLSLRALREAGFEPMAVASLACLVGTSNAVVPVAGLSDLTAMADLSRVSRGPATFEPADLDRLNAALVHDMPLERAAPQLAAFGGNDADFWAVVRGNLTFVREAEEWWHILKTGPDEAQLSDAFSDDAADVLDAASKTLPEAPWDETTFKAWTSAVKDATGAKGKRLFLPLRLALTGRASGPEMGPFLALLNRDDVTKRLAKAVEAATGTPA